MRILHAIHDFLPRHRAGSEIYAFELARAQSTNHHVTVLCADYDPGRRHGQVTWRVHAGLPVVEVVNNWLCTSFEDTYRPPLITDRLEQVLRAVQPEVVHVHNLLNLSFDLPSLAHAHGSAVVATLHDHSLVCPSGGQRLHRADEHLCKVIDTDRCARCFLDSPFHAQISFARLSAIAGSTGRIYRAAAAGLRRFPMLGHRVARRVRNTTTIEITRAQIDERLLAARRLFDEVDLFVAPSRSMSSEFQLVGIDPSKIETSDYGFAPLARRSNGHRIAGRPLRIGYVGSLVWHKGVHVLIDAVRAFGPRDYELKIFGSPDTFSEYSARLRTQSKGLSVQFMGAFDREHVDDVYSQIDVLVVPSLWSENSPLVIHEAYQAGVPVVGARLGGIIDLVEDGRTGCLYDPRSPIELVAALRRLVEDRSWLRRLSDGAGTRRVKSIVEDAREWEVRYADTIRRRPLPVPAS
jgi:glycosyltransferase involved in cell wall biosynthesis